MKANEAPEKLYFSSTENGTHYYTEGIPFEQEYIEYMRTDAFIEKACEWLEKYATYIHPRKGKEECIINLSQFKNYMKGE